MGTKIKTPEKDFIERLVPWLENQGWEVYQEVRIGRLEGPWRGSQSWGTADIVAIKAGLSQIIEAKTTLNLEVFDQVYRYREIADFISVAAPNAGRRFARRIADKFGIGLIGDWHQELKLIAAPRRRYPRRADFAEAMRRENFEKTKGGWRLMELSPHEMKPGTELSLPLMLKRLSHEEKITR